MRLFNIISLFCTTSVFAGFTPVDLRCDYAVNPLGVDSATPRLFWKLEAEGHNHRQTAYEILCASSEQILAQNQADLWDSGKVIFDESIQIPFQGKLNSWQSVFWKVRVWDENGKASAWSDTATWTMGVLSQADWHAQWIRGANTNIASLLLRHEFSVKAGLRRALVNICGLGQYNLTLNGNKVGEILLSPGWTEYDKTCLYDTFDITAELKSGVNAVGVELGNGMYHVTNNGRFRKFLNSFGPQKVIAQIRLEYADGSVEFIGTDENWKTMAGPITLTSIYGGEDCDARKIQRDWDKIEFNDDEWANAVVTSGSGGELQGQSCAAPPVKTFELRRVVSAHTLTNGEVVYDLGQNASYVPLFTVSGPVGSKVKLSPSEILNDDGSINQKSMTGKSKGIVWCEFTKGTDGEQTWSPKFYYVGCRYWQLHLTPADTNAVVPTIKSFAGVVVHSDCEPVGEFECSKDLFNRTFWLVRWAQQNNMVSLLSDCPHRERLGWLEQIYLNGPALRYDFDLDQLFTKTINDISDSQRTNGLVPTTAPEYAFFHDKTATDYVRNKYGDAPEWSAAFIQVPWQQYEFCGDLELFRRHFAAMTNYLGYLSTRATNYIINYGLGDWFDLGPANPRLHGDCQLTPIALTATAYYFSDAEMLARAAGLLGRSGDASYYSALAAKIHAAFNEKFYDATNRSYGTGSQCANAIPLVFGLCEGTNRAAVLNALVRDIRAHDNANTAGDVGYRYVLRALADGGRSDIIFEMNNQTNKPGYGMQIAKGKTSLTEGWDGSASQDHFMLGQIQEWFYHDLAGIQSGSIGFKKIIIAPQPVGDVRWVRASYNSIHGKIISQWQQEAGKFTLHVEIPANTTGTVYVPFKTGKTVKVNSTDVSFLRNEGDRAVYAIGSGNYIFCTD